MIRTATQEWGNKFYIIPFGVMWGLHISYLICYSYKVRILTVNIITCNASSSGLKKK